MQRNPRWIRTYICVSALFLALVCSPALGYSNLHRPDFNGDGKDDLAVGIPGKEVAFSGTSVPNAGAVRIIYGSSQGLKPFKLSNSDGMGNQLFTLASTGISGDPQSGDKLGSSLAWGDFNHDGYADLAVGIPFHDVTLSGVVVKDAGAVLIIYGSSQGLRATKAADGTGHANKLFTQSGTGQGASEQDDRFGEALAVGDFNGDGFADLAIGTPHEDVTTGGVTYVDAGAVNVLYGSADGLKSLGSQIFHQDSPGIADKCESDDLFGFCLAAGPISGNDGYEDLVIGVPREDDYNTSKSFPFLPIAVANCGAIQIIYSTHTISGLGPNNNRFVTLRDTYGHPDNQSDGRFGRAVAVGEFGTTGNGEDSADIAVGAPYMDVSGVKDAGAVYILYDNGFGKIEPTISVRVTQGTSSIPGAVEAGDLFGYSLATGDFGSTNDALAIGVPGESFGSTHDGVIHVLYAKYYGLSTDGNQLFSQSDFGWPNEQDDAFGTTLSVGDFDGSGHADLAVGAPYKDVGGANGAGAMYVIYDGYPELDPTGAGGFPAAQRWVENTFTFNVPLSKTDDHFGLGLYGN